MQVVALSDIGLIRKRNEDSFLIREEEGVFVVCDGMGGHKGGDVASNLAIEILEKEIDHDGIAITVPLINQAIVKANQIIYKKGHENLDWFEMGTTLTAAIINDLHVDICHVGDSRVYLVRENEIRQITKDHTLAEEMAKSGIIDNRGQKSYSHILTRALGVNEEIEIDNISLHVTPLDIILLCSDGLSDMLTNQELLTIISEGKDITAIADQLLHEALNKGGYDNITLILVKISGR